MLYADDAGVESRSPEGLQKMMTMTVTACSAFGLTVSEAKVEIMCLQTKDGRRVSFTVAAAGCSWPWIQASDRICVLGRSYQRR